MAVGHSAASVRPHGRRWIATSTTSCARASASPVTVSPCFGPCHCFRPCQLQPPHRQLQPRHPAPVPARARDGAHARAPSSWQMRTRPAHRSCCGSATAPSWARTRASWTPRPSRLGLRRRGARRRPPARSEARSEARRAARDGLASREARPVRQRSVYYMASCLVTPWHGRGHSPLVRATPLASRHCFQMSGRMFPHFSDKVILSICPLFSVLPPAARSRSSSPCNSAHPTTASVPLRVGYGSQPRQHPQSRQS